MRPEGTKCPPDELCPHPRELLAILDAMGVLSEGKIHVLGGVDGRALDADRTGHIKNDPTDLMGGSEGTVRLDPRRRNYWSHGRSDIVDISRSEYLVPEPSSMAPTLHQ
jgi:hypothetical protein